MTDEEIERFALVLKECARIRAIFTRWRVDASRCCGRSARTLDRACRRGS